MRKPLQARFLYEKPKCNDEETDFKCNRNNNYILVRVLLIVLRYKRLLF